MASVLASGACPLADFLHQQQSHSVLSQLHFCKHSTFVPLSSSRDVLQGSTLNYGSNRHVHRQKPCRWQVCATCNQRGSEGPHELFGGNKVSDLDSSRRAIVAGLLTTVAGLSVCPPFVPPSSAAELADAGRVTTQELDFAEMLDVLNAYKFKYPLSVSAVPTKFSWIETRKPERYSSAAPLAPDARQRIVSERLDYKNNLVISVSIGPPNRAFLRNPDGKEWAALDVARSVLSDKSTARLTPEQRLQEVAIDDTYTTEIDGETYWVYEYLTQKSPTNFDYSPDVYRHSLAVSASREGYIYTLNVSTLQSLWPKVEPAIREAVTSFQLTPVTSDYVPPWKDPWRFW